MDDGIYSECHCELWWGREYKAPDNRKCGACEHHVVMVEVGDGKPPRHTSGCELWECKFEPKEPILDKIRAKIKSLERFEIRGEVTPLVNVDRVLQIIDKAETEGT